MKRFCSSARGQATRRRFCGTHGGLRARRVPPGPAGRSRAARDRLVDVDVDDDWSPAAEADFFDFEPVFVLPERRWGSRGCRRLLAVAIFVVLSGALAAVPMHGG